MRFGPWCHETRSRQVSRQTALACVKIEIKEAKIPPSTQPSREGNVSSLSESICISIVRARFLWVIINPEEALQREAAPRSRTLTASAAPLGVRGSSLCSQLRPSYRHAIFPLQAVTKADLGACRKQSADRWKMPACWWLTCLNLALASFSFILPWATK